MVSKRFLQSGHAPTLLSAFLYFDLSFMTWVILGPLGVAIAKSFVQACGGSVEAEVPGLNKRGTCIRIRLPLAAQEHD